MFILKRYLGWDAESFLGGLSSVGMLLLVIRRLRNPYDLSHIGGSLFFFLYAFFALCWLVRQITRPKRDGFAKFEGQAAVVAVFSSLFAAFCFMLGRPGWGVVFLALSSAGYLAGLLFDLSDRLSKKSRLGREGK